jgi:hypothetical protein
MRMHVAAAVAALCLAPAGLAAQAAPRLGAQLSFAQDANAGIGLRFEQPLAPFWARDLRLDVTFDYYFPDAPIHYWELNGDLAWGFPISQSRLAVTVGGGLNVARSGVAGAPRSGEVTLGINLLVGLRFPTGRRLTPFIDLRPELGGGERLVLTMGLLF